MQLEDELGTRQNSPVTLGEGVPPHKGGRSEQKALWWDPRRQKKIDWRIQAYYNDVESGETKVEINSAINGG